MGESFTSFHHTLSTKHFSIIKVMYFKLRGVTIIIMFMGIMQRLGNVRQLILIKGEGSSIALDQESFSIKTPLLKC